MRKFSIISVMVGLVIVGLVMIGCDKDTERVTSYDVSSDVTYNAACSEDTYQEANALALELTGYSYREIKDFYNVSRDKDAFEEPECTEETMAAGGPWYCWVLLYGCLVGCDQSHGGSCCEDACYQGFYSCGGTIPGSPHSTR